MQELKKPAMTNCERQSKWLANPKNYEKRNTDRAKCRAETQPNVLRSTLIKYNLDIDQINTVREQNNLLKIEKFANECNNEDTNEQTEQRSLTYTDLNDYYRGWFSPFNDLGATQIDPKYEGSQREYRFQNYPYGVLKESNFKEYIGLYGFKTPSGKVSQQKGTIYNNLAKIGLTSISENIMPYLTKRDKDDKLSLLSVLTEDLSMQNGKTYNKNSVTKFIQAMLWLFETFNFITPGLLTQNEHSKIYKEYKDMYLQCASEGRGTELIPDVEPFSVLLQRVVNRFGMDSPQSLFMHLFQVIPVRDNFGELRIIFEKPNEDDLHMMTRIKNENWLYVPKAGTSHYKDPIVMYLANYKTQNLYGTQVIEFKTTDKMFGKQFAQVSKLIRKSLKNRISCDYLFTPCNDRLYAGGKLSKDFITPMLKAIDAEGSAKGYGINYLRHSFVSEFFDGKANDQQNVLRSKRMLHSPIMHEKYVYLLKIDKEGKLDVD